MTTKFEKKLDSLFWWLIALLPILVYFISVFHVGAELSQFNSYVDLFTFDYVADIFNRIFTENLAFPSILVNYLSYFISVEIIHIFVDVVVFLPRWFHGLLERWN